VQRLADLVERAPGDAIGTRRLDELLADRYRLLVQAGLGQRLGLGVLRRSALRFVLCCGDSLLGEEKPLCL